MPTEPEFHYRANRSPQILRPSVTFRNKLAFYGDELLAPRPTPNVEDYPLSTVRDCLFNIFAATLHIWRPYPQLQDPP